MTRSIFPALALLAPLLFSAAAPAAVITQPAGLNPGDPYRLVFVTSFSAAHDALSTDIAVYNNFVSGVAAGVPELSALATAWTAIVSTASVDARDNTATSGVGVPMYRLDGLRIATGDADLWDGTLENSLRVDQNGDFYFGQVWTGTQINGTEDPGFALGETSVQAGISLQTDSLWIASGSMENSTEISLYAISDVLFAQAAAVPEPATWLLALASLATSGLIAWRRRELGSAGTQPRK